MKPTLSFLLLVFLSLMIILPGTMPAYEGDGVVEPNENNAEDLRKGL